ncbi:hypothetical protein niasHT_024647 [Heterodera trifolii]|uniref:Uncharacterized protein n=1 Tax=Heterodera trifolii TaxID=157864 RepID=A0ABD2K7Q3_9BILA
MLQLGPSSSASGSTSSSSADSEAMVAPKSNGIEAPPKISEPFQLAHTANGVNGPFHQCKLLNEPPILVLGDGISCSAIGGGGAGCVAGSARRRSRSPGARRNAHSVQQPQPFRAPQQQHHQHQQQYNGANNGIYAQLGGRRPSVRENRQFGTNRMNC